MRRRKKLFIFINVFVFILVIYSFKSGFTAFEFEHFKQEFGDNNFTDIDRAVHVHVMQRTPTKNAILPDANIETHDTSELDIEKRMESRIARVAAICKKNNIKFETSNETQDLNSLMEMLNNTLRNKELYINHIEVNDKFKLLYCQVPKAGSTNVRRLFIHLLNLGEKETNSEPLDLSKIDPATAWIMSGKKVAYLRPVSESKLDQQRLRDYFRFTVVRHPFERLVSAYNMIFSDQRYFENFLYPAPNVNIIKSALYGEYNKSNSFDRTVTFKEFAKFVCLHDLKTKQGKWRIRYSTDNHWLSQTRLSFPCHAHYHAIGKLETFDEDMRYILKKLNINLSFTYPKKFKRTASSKFKHHMSSLGPEEIECLRRVYEADFELFGYKD